MDKTTRVKILDQAIYIWHCANTLEKDLNPFNLPQARGKSYDRLNL